MEDLNVAIIIDNSHMTEIDRERILHEAELLVLSMPESANLALIPYSIPGQDPYPRFNYEDIKPTVKLGRGAKNRAEMLNQIGSLEFTGSEKLLNDAVFQAETMFQNVPANSVKEIIYIGCSYANGGGYSYGWSPLPTERLKGEEIRFSALLTDYGEGPTKETVKATKGVYKRLKEDNLVNVAARVTAEIMLHCDNKSVQGKVLDRKGK